MRQLYGLAVRQGFDVNLAQRIVGGRTANKDQFPAIRRERRLAYRIGQPRELKPFGVPGTNAHPESNSGHEDRNTDGGGNHLPALRGTLHFLDRSASVGYVGQPLIYILLKTLPQQIADSC